MRQGMLILLSLFICLYATTTGLFLVLLPREDWILWPQQWLSGTPFTNLRVPGILLFLLVGVTNGWAAWNLINEHPRQHDRALWGGYCLISWIIFELLTGRELYLIHLSAFLLGILMVLLSYQEKEKWAV